MAKTPKSIVVDVDAAAVQKVLAEASELDQLRQAQLSRQLSSINRLVGMVMEVHRIVAPHVPPEDRDDEYQERHDEIKDFLVLHLKTPPQVKFHTEDGRLWMVDSAEMHGDDLVVNLIPVGTDGG